MEPDGITASQEGLATLGNMIQVHDNFIPEIDSVRQSFIDAGFGTWKPTTAKVGSGNYEGMGFMGNHAPLIRALTKVVGGPIAPNRMFARVTNQDTERAYVHSDRSAGDFTCIVYLSKHKELSGTSFYRHKETGLTEMPLEWMDDKQRASEMVNGDGSLWEQTDFIRGDYNRALIFSAPLFHSRFPLNGIGNDEQTGRIVWATHFSAL